jgi:hypothetical protein
MLAEVHRDGEVLDQRSEDDMMIVRARLDERSMGRLRQAGIRITVSSASANGRLRTSQAPAGANADGQTVPLP